MRPIQSPRLETTCAIQSRKNDLRAEDAPRGRRDRRLLGVGGDERRRLLRSRGGQATWLRGRRRGLAVRCDGDRASSSAASADAFVVGRLAASSPLAFFAAALLRRGLLLGRRFFLAVAFFFASPSGRFFGAGRGPRARAAARPPPRGSTASGSTPRGTVAFDGAVGDVGAEAAVEHAHRRAGVGVRARARRAAASAGAPPALLGLGEERLRLGERDREQLRPRTRGCGCRVPFFRYGPYRPFCAVISCAVGVGADDPRQRRSCERLVERDRVEAPSTRTATRASASPSSRRPGSPSCTNGPKRPREHEHRRARSRDRCPSTRGPPALCAISSSASSTRELVGREVGGRSAPRSSPRSRYGAVAARPGR